MRNILLTGIPRSGTSLAAALLEQQPQTVCLQEPEWQRPHPSLNAADFAAAIEADMVALRHKILEGGPVPDRRRPDGGALTNYYDTENNEVFIEVYRKFPPLAADFTLAVKHNGPYLGVLPELIARNFFEIHVVIRNPLAILRSWRRRNLPITHGDLPHASLYWPALRKITESSAALLDKQAQILELLFLRIMEHRSQVTLCRYEDFAGPEASQQLAAQADAEDEMLLAALERHAPNMLECYS